MTSNEARKGNLVTIDRKRSIDAQRVKVFLYNSAMAVQSLLSKRHREILNHNFQTSAKTQFYYRLVIACEWFSTSNTKTVPHMLSEQMRFQRSYWNFFVVKWTLQASQNVHKNGWFSLCFSTWKLPMHSLWCSWHRQTRFSLLNRWAWRHGNQAMQPCMVVIIVQRFRTGMRISLCTTLQGLVLFKPRRFH